jgi:NitT/TauT family transport system substrate-binding protein
MLSKKSSLRASLDKLGMRASNPEPRRCSGLLRLFARDDSGYVTALLLTLSIVATATTARAADTIRAAKPANTWTFIPLDVGMQQGIYQKYGIELEISVLGGDAKVQQALAAGSLDIGLGSGPAMAFAAKGAPAHAIAAYAGPPQNMSIVVAVNSPIKTVDDLKGKLLGITTVGSLTDWLAKRIGATKSWGSDAVRVVALGGSDAELPAMKTGQIDGMVTASEVGYTLEEKGQAKILTELGDYAPHFITHVVFARDALIDDNPALVERFLKGFFASIAFMKTHKAETSAVAEAVIHQSPEVASKAYDGEISMLEDDGHFDPTAVAVIKQSLIDMKMLESQPSDDQLFTTKFVPVKLP